MTPTEKPTTNQDSRYTAPWEKSFDKVITPFEEFIHNQTTGSILLMVCTVIALLLANSALAPTYQHIIHTPISLHIGSFSLERSLLHWINEGLMTFFFFVVGLEIKRAVLVGELASLRQAALPILAAIGGMVVPALFYFMVNPEGVSARGWGIPMATDIAFAVGALVLLGARIPKSLVLFLVALAIVDDLGAVLVIAVFYTEQIAMSYLTIAGGLLLLLIVFNLGGIRHPLPYFLVSVLLWLMLLQSGVHATVAGVLGALTVPARPRYEPTQFSAAMRGLLDHFDASQNEHDTILRNDHQRAVAQNLEHRAQGVRALLQRMEHLFDLPVALLVIPLFALANAGIPIDFARLGTAIGEPVTLGVIIGLMLGKFLGISGVCWLALKLGVGQLPEQTRFPQIMGVGWLAGIGFTMSIFIAELAFSTAPESLQAAKLGILLSSLLAGIIGYVWLMVTTQAPVNTN